MVVQTSTSISVHEIKHDALQLMLVHLAMGEGH